MSEGDRSLGAGWSKEREAAGSESGLAGGMASQCLRARYVLHDRLDQSLGSATMGGGGGGGEGGEEAWPVTPVSWSLSR